MEYTDKLVCAACHSGCVSQKRCTIVSRYAMCDSPVMMVSLSYHNTAQTLASWPCSTEVASILPSCHTLASESQLPLTNALPSSLTSSEHTFPWWPNRSASALSCGDLPGRLNSMIASCPPETI